MTGAVQKIGFGLNLFYLYKHKYINNITRYNILYKWDSDFFFKSVSQYCNQSSTYIVSDLKIQKYKVDTNV